MDSKIVNLGNNTIAFEYENNGIYMDNLNVWSADRISNRVSIHEAKDLMEMLKSLIECHNRMEIKNMLRAEEEDRIEIKKYQESLRKYRVEYINRDLPCSKKEQQSRFNKFRKRCEEDK